MTALSLALGADLFSVAVPLGMVRMGLGMAVRLSAIFAVCHMMLMMVGLTGGGYLASTLERIGASRNEAFFQVENWAGIAGGAVLILLGVMMLGGSREGEVAVRVPTGIALLVLAVSVSCDALAAGISSGLIAAGRGELIGILGAVIFAVSMIGLSVGRLVGRVLVTSAQPLGGIVLVVWGIYTITRLIM